MQQQMVSGGDEFENEPPLLEELGIHPEHIVQKTLSGTFVDCPIKLYSLFHLCKSN